MKFNIYDQSAENVKPNYFIGMFRNSSDIDRLSTCLNSIHTGR